MQAIPEDDDDKCHVTSRCILIIGFLHLIIARDFYQLTRMSYMKLTSILLLVELVTYLSAYPTGPPLQACQSMVPQHGANAQTSAAPYRITMNSTVLTANGVYAVTVTATGTPFRGIFVQARPSGCNPPNANTGRGQFTLLSGETYLQTLDCNSNIASGVGHSNNNATTTKTFYWTAPANINGNMYFQGTFVQTRPVFWTEVKSPLMQDPNAQSSDDCNGGTTLKMSFISFIIMIAGVLICK